MNYYEVIYETGTHSIIAADSDEEALRGLVAHHARAVQGETGGPTGHPAERIKKVLKYDKHPMEDSITATVKSEDLKTLVNEIIDEKTLGDQVSVEEVLASVRVQTSPVIVNSDPHESDYIEHETGTLEGSWSE